MDAMMDAFDESFQAEKLTATAKRKSLVGDTENDAVQNSSTEPQSNDLDELIQEEKVLTSANKNSESVERIKKFIENTQEPFINPKPNKNVWLKKDGSCIIV